MPAIANVVINDAKATPVAHTFEPARTSADMASWEDRAATQYIGFNKLTCILQRPTGPTRVANRNLHLIVRLETPVLETLASSDAGIIPAPTVSYRPMVECKFTLPERSSTQERKDLRELLRNSLNNSIIAAMVDSFSMPY